MQMQEGESPLRVAVLGIGNELRGDDAVGTLAAQQLRKYFHTGHVLIVDGSLAPENCTGVVRRFQPDLVLLIDAADMNMPPGTICWLPWRETDGLTASTHTLPLHVLMGFLVNELGCEAVLIGIQPQQTTFNTLLSPAVQRALDCIVEVLTVQLR
jgi:hydrogenase 3 maturation protease